MSVILEAPVVDGDLLSWARKLKTLLETTFGWELKNSAANLIDEDDEFAPVVAEMDGSCRSRRRRSRKRLPGNATCAPESVWSVDSENGKTHHQKLQLQMPLQLGQVQPFTLVISSPLSPCLNMP